jgi:hypothetical protein
MMHRRPLYRLSFAVLVAVLGAGCHKPSAAQKGAAPNAAHHLEPSRELERGTARSGATVLRESREAAEAQQREKDDVAAAADRERTRYKQVLSKEIGWLDRRVLELQNETARAAGTVKEAKERDLSDVRSFRARLKVDLDDVESVDDRDWPTLKERIDQDLEDERPSSVPRSFEKSYAI